MGYWYIIPNIEVVSKKSVLTKYSNCFLIEMCSLFTFHYILLFSSNFNFHSTGIVQKPALKNVHFFRRFYTGDNNIGRCMHVKLQILSRY